MTDTTAAVVPIVIPKPKRKTTHKPTTSKTTPQKVNILNANDDTPPTRLKKRSYDEGCDMKDSQCVPEHNTVKKKQCTEERCIGCRSVILVQDRFAYICLF